MGSAPLVLLWCSPGAPLVLLCSLGAGGGAPWWPVRSTSWWRGGAAAGPGGGSTCRPSRGNSVQCVSSRPETASCSSCTQGLNILKQMTQPKARESEVVQHGTTVIL